MSELADPLVADATLPELPGPGPGLPSEGFRAMMRSFPTGVAVVTTRDGDGRPWGMTCSSVCSLSMDPPMLLLCLRSASPTLEAIAASGRFSVNLLHERAQDTAELFASGDPERFDRVQWRLDAGEFGPHLLRDAHAVADCRVDRPPVAAGDHGVLFGRVCQVARRPGRWPLLYGFRRYRRWSHA